MYGKKVAAVFVILLGMTAGAAAWALAAGTQAWVKVAVLNVRSRPDTAAALVGTWNLADKVDVLEKDSRLVRIGEYYGNWFRVRKGALTGWVYGPFLSNVPVMTADQVQQLIQGTFYYHDVNDYNHIKRILYIRGSDYEEKLYASGRGLVDIYYGKVAHQADSIEMMPARRNTRMREDRPSGSGYSTPSYSSDNFSPVSDWRKVNEGRIKYFLFHVDDKLYLTVERPLSSNEERRAQFKRVTWVYIRKQ